MIELPELKNGQKVWWGNFEIGSSDRVSSFDPPREYTVELVTTTKKVKIIDSTGTECIYWRWYFSPANYGTSLANSLYATKEDLMEDWNRKFNESLRKLDCYQNRRRNTFIKNLTIE